MNKTVSVLFGVILSLANCLFPQNAEGISLEELRDWYSGRCASLVINIDAASKEGAPSEPLLREADNAGILRAKVAAKHLAPFIGLNRGLQYVPPVSQIDRIGIMRAPVTLQDMTDGISKHFPVLGALKRIGIPYQYVETQFGNENLLSLFSLHLGCASGGEFFLAKVQKYGHAERDFIIQRLFESATKNPIPEEYLELGKNDSPIAKEYGTAEDFLLSRFAEELADSSPTIADTIRTMGHIRSLKAIPLLTENLTICPQVSTNAPGGYVFPAAEALIEIGPAIGYCFSQLEETKPLSVKESLWLRISHELYPEGLEYDLMRRAETNDTRAARLLDSLTWRRLDSNYEIIGIQEERNNGSE